MLREKCGNNAWKKAERKARRELIVALASRY
jgi:hypothetical protein